MTTLFGWSATAFDKLLDRATSHMQLEPDWDAILQLCDCIRQGDVQPKYALSSIKKKLYAPNPHVVLYALQVLESCVKNCGSPIHMEVASRQFMEELRELVKNTTNENVKNRILELIQAWAHAFRNEPKYRAIQDIFNLLRVEGFKLQVLKESDAMFIADTAPDWADGDCCHRCRVQFSVVQRKHHCRNCGQIFCQKCSARNSPIPRFGIEKEVRVCEACWDKLNKPSSSPKSSSSNSESSPQQNPQNGVGAGGKSEQELKEEEDLQLAIALSQSEAESKEKHLPSMKSSLPSSYSTILDASASTEINKKGTSSTDNELDRYLNRSYWEQRQQQQQHKEETVIQQENRTSPVPSAPVSTSVLQSEPTSYIPPKISEKYQNGDVDEMSDFLSNLQTMVEIFVNRLKSNSSRGRPIVNDTYVQSLFMNITNMHSQLLKYVQEQDDSRAHYERLQDKLNQIRDARAALDALREEHMEKLRREAEEADRQKQIQMAQKLEIMRKKKQEYLQYQRQLAIQRMQEQEREMQLRQEQLKQQYQVLHQGGALPAGVPPQQGPYMPPASQAYPIMHTAMPANAQGHPAFLPNFRPPQQQPAPTNSSTDHPVSTGNFRQPFNMQAMAGAIHAVQPGVPYPQPNAPGNTVIPNQPSSQPPMMVMGPMPQQVHMIPPSIPQQMIQQQNTPVTSVVSIPQGSSVSSVLANVPPMAPPSSTPNLPQQHTMPPAAPEHTSDPLIVFD